jgi:di/tripeptidase
MGPGSIQMAHTSRESVPIPQVETMVSIFDELLTSGPEDFPMHLSGKGSSGAN